MIKMVTALLVVLTLGFAKDVEVKKDVYDLTTGKLEDFELRILKATAYNASHYEAQFEELKVAVIIHGQAYKYFITDRSSPLLQEDKKLLQSYQDLHKRIVFAQQQYGISFLMCGSGMKKRNIDPKDLVEGVKVTPNASIGLIDKQNEGFAYIPVR